MAKKRLRRQNKAGRTAFSRRPPALFQCWVPAFLPGGCAVRTQAARAAAGIVPGRAGEAPLLKLRNGEGLGEIVALRSCRSPPRGDDPLRLGLDPRPRCGCPVFWPRREEAGDDGLSLGVFAISLKNCRSSLMKSTSNSCSSAREEKPHAEVVQRAEEPPAGAPL